MTQLYTCSLPPGACGCTQENRKNCPYGVLAEQHRENIDEFTCSRCDRVRSMHEFTLNPEELICDDCTREREENEAERAYERHNEALMAGDIPTEREKYLHAWDEKQVAKGRKGRGT